MKNSKINQKIIDLWAKSFPEPQNINIPAFYPDPKKGGILFIGMNPSYNQRAIVKLLKESIVFNKENIERIFSYRAFLEYKDKDERVDFLTELESSWIENLYPYFRPMVKIANDNNLLFQHIDLFGYRQTSQKDFERLVIKKESKDNIEFTDFGIESLKIFNELLNQHTPDIIVVANSQASKIFKQEFANDLEWNEKKGYHLFKNNTPIFFSGMLSGQRALDIHSRERLEWQIRNIINQS